MIKADGRQVGSRPRAVTIKDVAAEADVSLQTVSRVINDGPNVRPAIKAARPGRDRKARLCSEPRGPPHGRHAILSASRAQRPRPHHRGLAVRRRHGLGRPDAARRDAGMRQERIPDDLRAGRHAQLERVERELTSRAGRDPPRRRHPDAAARRQSGDHRTCSANDAFRLRVSGRRTRVPASP